MSYNDEIEDPAKRRSIETLVKCAAGFAVCAHPFTQALASESEKPWSPIRGRSDYVIELGASEPLIAVNSDKLIVPASMTKLATLAIALREEPKGNFDFGKKIFLSPNARSQPPYKSGLKWASGEEVFNLCAVRSHNDMAVALAEDIAGTEWDFHRKFMMPLAEELDMKDTEFWNVSGLPKPGIGENVSTTQDLGKLVEYLLTEHSDSFELFGQATYTHPKFKDPLINTNGLLENSVNKFAVPTKGVDWGKTGYVGISGYQIALSCERDGRRFIVISTGHPSAQARNDHVHNMIEAVFADLKPIEKPSHKREEQENVDPCLLTECRVV